MAKPVPLVIEMPEDWEEPKLTLRQRLCVGLCIGYLFFMLSYAFGWVPHADLTALVILFTPIIILGAWS